MIYHLKTSIQDLVDDLQKGVLFSTLDLKCGYWQVHLKEECKKYTAFSTPNGHYEFNRIPFGLTNAPATFQRLMNMVLAQYVNVFVKVYLDDVIIYSTSIEEHTMHIKLVLEALAEANLKINTKNCFFFLETIKYLGSIVGNNQVPKQM
jgi:hypothetical protein